MPQEPGHEISHETSQETSQETSEEISHQIGQETIWNGGGGHEAGQTPLPGLAALVCELRPADDLVDGSAQVRDRVVEILRSQGGEVDPVQGNPDATAALFGPDDGDGAAAWSAVVAAARVRDAVAEVFGETTVRIGVAASGVDPDPASLGLWRTHVVDLATWLQRTAAADEAILNARTHDVVGTWVEVEAAQTDDTRGETFRLLGVAPAPSGDASAYVEVPSLEVEVGDGTGAEGWDLDAPDPDDPDVGWPELAIAPLEDTGEWFADEQAPTAADPEAVPEASEPATELPQPDHLTWPDLTADEAAQDEADGGGPAPQAGWRLVGREAELEALRSAFAAVAGKGRPVTVSLHGPDGIGKTAVVATFASELTNAFVIPLESPPLELGGATRPLVSLIETLAAVEPTQDADAIRDAIRPLLGEGPDTDAERLAALVTGDGRALAAEVRPALTRLLRESARHAPVVIVVDEATNLTRGAMRALEDILRDADAAVLIVMVHDGTVAMRADHDVAVSSLPAEAIGAIADTMVGHGGLAAEARDAIVRAVAGNALAAEQMVAMLLDDGFLRWEYGRWVATAELETLSLPADVRSLVDARIDRLEPADRDLLAAAAAFGDRFPVEGVAPDGAAPERMRLDALVERRFLAVVDEHEMAFAHALVRRMATTPLADRYVRAAEWMDGAGRGRGPSGADLIGSRLAIAARAEWDPDVARRAAALLALAAEGTVALGDDDASLQLLRSATSLLVYDDPTRTDLLLEAGLRIAQRGDTFAAERVLAEAAFAAREGDDPRGEARANVLRAAARASGGSSEEALQVLRDAADAAIALGEPSNDETGLAWAWGARASVHRRRGHWAATADAAERAATHAAAAGRRSEEISALLDAGRAVIDGPTPVAESRERCERIAARLRGSTPAEQEVEAIAAVLLAREGSAEEARDRADAAVAALEDGPHRGALARCLWLRAQVEIVARDGHAAEPFLRRSIETSNDAKDSATRARAAATLANVLVDLGTTDGLESLIALARDGTARDDVFAQVAWRCARAKQRAAEGRSVEARGHVRTAVRIADQTDLIELRAATLLDHAEVMRLLGRPNEAQPSAYKALRSLERRGAASSAERARAMIDLLQRRLPEPSDETPRDDAPTGGSSGDEDMEPEEEPPSDEDGTPPLLSPQSREPIGATPETGAGPVEPERRERRWFW